MDEAPRCAPWGEARPRRRMKWMSWDLFFQGVGSRAANSCRLRGRIPTNEERSRVSSRARTHWGDPAAPHHHSRRVAARQGVAVRETGAAGGEARGDAGRFASGTPGLEAALSAPILRVAEAAARAGVLEVLIQTLGASGGRGVGGDAGGLPARRGGGEDALEGGAGAHATRGRGRSGAGLAADRSVAATSIVRQRRVTLACVGPAIIPSPVERALGVEAGIGSTRIGARRRRRTADESRGCQEGHDSKK